MSGNSSSTNLGANAVAIQNFAFNPATLNVQVGTKVTWKNLDSAAHHVVSDTGAFDSGVLNNGQSYSFTFNQAGNYPYHCSIHPSMKGTIVVTTTAPSNPSTSTPSTTGGSGY
jgi:plastocyanin